MREEQRKKYEALKATGAFSEEELERLRIGFEKPPRIYDKKKSDLHMTTVGIVQKIEDEIRRIYFDSGVCMTSSWQPEGKDDDGNAYIFIDITRDGFLPVLSFSGKLKSKLEKALKNADEVEMNWEKNTVYIKLIFRDIITEGTWDDEAE